MNKSAIQTLDNAYKTIEDLLRDFRKSAILQEYFAGQYTSLFFGNMIQKFIKNLNEENIRKLGLKRGQVSLIRREYRPIIKKARAAISMSLKKEIVDEKYYDDFKADLLQRFPDYIKIIERVEQEINYNETKAHLERRKKEIDSLGIVDADLSMEFKTCVIEKYVKQYGCLPSASQISRLMKQVTKVTVPKIAKDIRRQLRKESPSLIRDEASKRLKFESGHYRKWKGALDLLECLIYLSFEVGEKLHSQSDVETDQSCSSKIHALTRIHVRALRISNEILTLLRSGYADGANARWRSLHELTVISLFLTQKEDEISERYLNHSVIRTLKDACDYQKHCKKLGYPPLKKGELKKLNEQRDRLIQKYGKEFGCPDYGWLPVEIEKRKRNFKGLEELVELDRLRPYYNLACDAVHGGSKGFYQLSLMDDFQDKILLVGPSNYGLADVLQNSAVSLFHVTHSFLRTDLNFDNLVSMWVMYYFAMEIKSKALIIQAKIEKEEKEKI